MRRSLAIAAAGLALSWSAEADANDPAAAQALFDQARDLMKQGRWAEACPKLEESQQLDPGGGTLLHLALCRENEGRIATAWAHYQEALAQAKRDHRKDRAKIAGERIRVLSPRLPKIRVRVPPEDRSLEGFEVARDDLAVGAAQWGESVPIDPGRHELTARAKGRAPWSTVVTIPDGPDETVVDVPLLESAPEPSASASEAPPTTTPIDRPASGETQRTLGLVAGGVGVVGLAVGSVFGLVSISKRNEADAECRPPDYTRCTAKGVDDGDAATRAGNVSTIAFIAGGALLAGGVILYLTAPSGGAGVGVAPSVGPRGGSLALTGRF